MVLFDVLPIDINKLIVNHLFERNGKSYAPLRERNTCQAWRLFISEQWPQPSTLLDNVDLREWNVVGLKLSAHDAFRVADPVDQVSFWLMVVIYKGIAAKRKQWRIQHRRWVSKHPMYNKVYENIQKREHQIRNGIWAHGRKRKNRGNDDQQWTIDQLARLNAKRTKILGESQFMHDICRTRYVLNDLGVRIEKLLLGNIYERAKVRHGVRVATEQIAFHEGQLAVWREKLASAKQQL